MQVADNKEIGQIIKSYRKMLNLTQFQLAEMVEIDEKQLGKIERGVHYPSVPTFLKLLKILNIDINKFCIISENENISVENRFLTQFEKLSLRDRNIICNIIEVFQKQQSKSVN